MRPFRVHSGVDEDRGQAMPHFSVHTSSRYASGASAPLLKQNVEAKGGGWSCPNQSQPQEERQKGKSRDPRTGFGTARRRCRPEPGRGVHGASRGWPLARRLLDPFCPTGVA
ncbi:hypothetical protein HPB50_005523 [Hyalomma asiaticum]|uniref:Uncharacterized protein n=1 Tax=Hyalomma asiaticum TaxID=266040 RepID=A0ACB7TFE7_HYAAI|nr:hypothetical protein HPB50_005523 [Hyalomma asiaticum]